MSAALSLCYQAVHYYAPVVCIAVGVSVVRESTQGAAAAADHDEPSLPQLTQEGPFCCLSIDTRLPLPQ